MFGSGTRKYTYRASARPRQVARIATTSPTRMLSVAIEVLFSVAPKARDSNASASSTLRLIADIMRGIRIGM